MSLKAECDGDDARAMATSMAGVDEDARVQELM